MITTSMVEQKTVDGWGRLFASAVPRDSRLMLTGRVGVPAEKRERIDRGVSVPSRFFAPALQRRDVSRCVMASVGRDSVAFVPVFATGGDTELACQPVARYTASGARLANEGRTAVPDEKYCEEPDDVRAALGMEEVNPAREAGLVCRKAFETVGAAKVAAARLYAAGVGAVVRVGRAVVVTCTVPIATAATVRGLNVRRQLLAHGFEIVCEQEG